ncbi:unnamed protein product [Fraxinus pennsylvanica]|uniref:Heat shock protein 70 n=1 Tax=Fraxinus pennsylvanica TaxID=56036 RepID=A0AAD2EDA3_9LAMI|nr:unnamed protein product [Fraxinus pennsylvanica]
MDEQEYRVAFDIEAPAFGINIGTSQCTVAVWNGSQVEILRNNPPANVYKMFSIFNMKRLIGRHDMDPAVHAGINLPFPVQNLKIGARLLFAALVNKMWKFINIEEGLEILIGELKVMAETQLQHPIEKVVLTVPVSFNRLQLRIITKACHALGLSVLSLIPEPTAVAMLYAQQQKQKQNAHKNMGSGSEKIALIFNMGAGFCDVAVVTVTGGVCRTRGLAGGTLGGEDILQNTMRHLLPDMNRYFSRHSINEIRKMRISTQDAIHKLSIEPSAEIDVNFENGSKIFKVLNRKEFEEVNQNVFEKCASLINQCLHDAEIEADKVDDIILVGGCSNIPKIQKMVIDIFRKELYLGMNPLEAAVCGAALEGAVTSGVQNPSGILDLSWTKKTPMSFGIRADGNNFIPIMPKNTELPASEDLLFTTLHDNQTEALIFVYEGNETSVEKNHLLGYFKYTGIPQAPKGDQVIKVCITNFGLYHLQVITARVICNDKLTAPTVARMPNVDERGVLLAESLYRTYGSTLDLATVRKTEQH